jgi:hypothetical protein
MADLITPETATKEALQEISDQALMETSCDKDGDLRVKDGISCWVFPKGDRIRLLSLFGFKAGVNQQQRLELVNTINVEYIIVRASVGGTNDALFFDHDIMITGGVTKLALLHTTKRFLQIPIPAIQEHGGALVEYPAGRRADQSFPAERHRLQYRLMR